LPIHFFPIIVNKTNHAGSESAMTKWKWILWIAAGALVFFYTRSDTNPDRVSANDTDIKLYHPIYNPDQSIIDYLIYRSMVSGQAKMAVTGSSVTKGSGSSQLSKTWPNRIQQHLRLQHPNLRSLHISNHGYSGYTSIRLLEDHVLKPIYKEQPDVLFIETSVINNHIQNVSLDDTFNSLDSLVDKYTTALPETRILFLSPNPCTENKFGPQINQLGLTFTDYVDETATYIKDKGWAYFDTQGAMLTEMNNQNITLSSTLKDGIHPNDRGYQIWSDVLWRFMQQKN